MKRNELEEMGLTKEQVDSIMSTNGADIENAKAMLQKDIDGLNSQIRERDKQLEELKKTAGDSESLKSQIADLQKANADQKKAHEGEIAQLKLDNAIENALTTAGAKNSKAVRALIDTSKVKLDEDGKLTGWDDQIAEVKKTDAYLFNEAAKQTFTGFKPGASGDVKPDTGIDTSKMTYSQMVAYMEEHPDAKI